MIKRSDHIKVERHDTTRLFHNPEIATEYERWCRQLGYDEPTGRYSIKAGDVLKAHFLVADHFRTKGEGMGGVGPKSLHLLHSAVSRQWAGFGNRSKWNTLTDVAATLFFGIVRNHPFHDANKRTALLSTLYQLQCHNRVPNVPAADFEELTERVAARALEKYRAYESVEGDDDPEVRFVSRFLRRNTRETDQRKYVVTYRQLDRLLRRHDAWLDNPSAAGIDVMVWRETTVAFVKRRKPFAILKVGFHDWGTEVSRDTVERIRDVLGLTPARGVDSKVFFQGLEPLESLLVSYRQPLERLAFK